MPESKTPSDVVVRAARMAAARSPCQKSKRGAVLFNPITGIVSTPAWNSRPDDKCDTRCQPLRGNGLKPIVLHQTPSRCSMMCVHAESRAVRFALEHATRSQFVGDGDFTFDVRDMELLHVKIDDKGELVTSGGPSCWQCARELADVGVLGVWLYEETATSRDPREGAWNFYMMKEFYDLTMKDNDLA